MGERFSSLGISFSPEIRIIDEPFRGGYRIHVRAPWRSYPGVVRCFRILLSGRNPLTGNDVRDLGIGGSFTFDNQEFQTGTLSFHGSFAFLKYVVYTDGSEECIGSEPLKLYYPPNAPFVRFWCSPTANRQGYKKIEIESNCWRSCTGKIWLGYDERTQRLPEVSQNSGRFAWYLPTKGRVDIRVTDDMIQLEKR